MPTRPYLVALASLLLACSFLLHCGGSGEPAKSPLLGFCTAELVKLGAEPGTAEALCQAGGEALQAELARLRETALARATAVPCADTSAPAPFPPIPAVGTGGGP